MMCLFKNQHGVSAIEFALALPPFLVLVMGAIQLGVIASARTGLQHAVDEGARFASIYPRPSDAQIIARVTSREFGLDPAYMQQPTIVQGTEHSVPYTEISMSYSRPLDFILFETGPLTISYTKRAY